LHSHYEFYFTMQLLVLAGGFGTRLKSVVSSVPKPLAPVKGRPFLNFQMENWISQGITDFTFLLHYEAKKIIDFITNWQQVDDKRGINIRFIVEDKPLGTGGSVANAVKKLKIQSKFFVSNADTWLDSGFSLLSESPSPSIAVTKVNDISRYGSVILDEHNYVKSFAEKVQEKVPGIINAGISCLDPKIFLSWNGKICSLETDFLPRLAKDGNLFSVRLDVNFIDIGIPEDYDRFCKLVEKDKIPL